MLQVHCSWCRVRRHAAMCSCCRDAELLPIAHRGKGGGRNKTPTIRAFHHSAKCAQQCAHAVRTANRGAGRTTNRGSESTSGPKLTEQACRPCMDSRLALTAVLRAVVPCAQPDISSAIVLGALQHVMPQHSCAAASAMHPYTNQQIATCELSACGHDCHCRSAAEVHMQPMRRCRLHGYTPSCAV